jgi:uncharacterized protein YutE (UPF0331/DUF86 family)
MSSRARGGNAPDYASAIDELGKLGVLPLELSTRLRPLAGFRNALVHGYLDLDVNRLYAALNERLTDVREFARFMDAHAQSATR